MQRRRMRAPAVHVGVLSPRAPTLCVPPFLTPPPRSCCRAQYDELKAKKESIEKGLEEKMAEDDKKRKAQEKLSLKSKKKAKATLSFDADEEEG